MAATRPTPALPAHVDAPYRRLMTATCPDCGKPFGPGRKRTETITGRVVCEECGAGLIARTVRVLSNPDAPVGGAIATEGWFRRVRNLRRQSKREDRDAR